LFAGFAWFVHKFCWCCCGQGVGAPLQPNEDAALADVIK